MDFEIRFRPSGRRVRMPAGATLFDAARRAALPLASSCGAEGLCARCGVQVLAGGDALAPESAQERRAKLRNRVDAGLRLACRTRIAADLVVTAPYW